MATPTWAMTGSDFQMFVNSGTHADWAEWPSACCAVVPAWVFGKPIIVRNKYGIHAEENLIPIIEEEASIVKTFVLIPSQTVKIKILQNYSPCGNCSDLYWELQKYLQWLSNKKQVCFKLEIAFSAFYGIKRPLCEYYNHNHDTDGYRHQRNIEGINRLLNAGVSVHPFCKDDWRDLASCLVNYTLGLRQEEDISMRQDFGRLFPGWG